MCNNNNNNNNILRVSHHNNNLNKCLQLRISSYNSRDFSKNK